MPEVVNHRLGILDPGLVERSLPRPLRGLEVERLEQAPVAAQSQLGREAAANLDRAFAMRRLERRRDAVRPDLAGEADRAVADALSGEPEHLRGPHAGLGECLE